MSMTAKRVRRDKPVVHGNAVGALRREQAKRTNIARPERGTIVRTAACAECGQEILQASGALTWLHREAMTEECPAGR